MKTSQLCLFQGGTQDILLPDGPFASTVKRSSLRPTQEDSLDSWHKRFLSKPVPLKLTRVYMLKRCKHKSGIPLRFSKRMEVPSDCFNPSKPITMQTILLSAIFQHNISFEIFFQLIFFLFTKRFQYQKSSRHEDIFLGP